MAEKENEEVSNVVIANGVPTIETDLSETLGQLKEKIVELDKELQDTKKNNKKLEKRNKNFKDSIQKMIEEKRHIEDLSKIIEEQNLKIEDYKKQLDDLRSSQKAETEMEQKLVEQNTPVPSAEQNDKLKITEQSVLLKQLELLTFKNHELKAELDRRTKLSDQLKKEHETILKDRNELLSDVKTLKHQVEEMKLRLDRSFTLLSKKRTPKQSDAASSEKVTNHSTRNSPRGILHRKEKTSTTTSSVFQDKKTTGGRLILNSGKMLPKDPCKRPRTTKSLKENTSKIPVPSKEKVLQVSKATDNLEDSSKTKGNTDDLTTANTKAHKLEPSGSIQDVIEKRVVTDIRAKLEKNKPNEDCVLSSNTKLNSNAAKEPKPSFHQV